MYCPTSLHDNTSRYPNLALLQQRWQSIYSKTSDKNLPYKISFTGGEVSSNKSFLPLLEWLRNNYGNNIFKILVTSNGSASLRYYTKLFDQVDNLSLSFHSEHADENKFSDIVQAQDSRDVIAAFIDELIEKYPIDKNKVTLIGFSQGSILSYAVALSYPEKVQRVVAMSGYLNTEIAVDDFAKK
jgi:predicted esterase